METPGRATPSTSPPTAKSGRFKSLLPVFAIMAGFGTYWYAFPDGILNAVAGVTPSIGTSACLGIAKTPLCYVFGWSTTEHGEAATFNVTERQARIQALAAEYGQIGEFRLSGGPHLSEEEDRVGYVNWLGNASEADFAKMLEDLDAQLRSQVLMTDINSEEIAP